MNFRGVNAPDSYFHAIRAGESVAIVDADEFLFHLGSIKSRYTMFVKVLLRIFFKSNGTTDFHFLDNRLASLPNWLFRVFYRRSSVVGKKPGVRQSTKNQ